MRRRRAPPSLEPEYSTPAARAEALNPQSAAITAAARVIALE